MFPAPDVRTGHRTCVEHRSCKEVVNGAAVCLANVQGDDRSDGQQLPVCTYAAGVAIPVEMLHEQQANAPTGLKLDMQGMRAISGARSAFHSRCPVEPVVQPVHRQAWLGFRAHLAIRFRGGDDRTVAAYGSLAAFMT